VAEELAAPAPIVVKPPGLVTTGESATPAPLAMMPPGLHIPEEPAVPAPIVVKPPSLVDDVASSKHMVLPLPLPAFTAPMPMPSARQPYIPTPMGYNSARFCPMSANLQPQESPEAANIKQISGGRPVKVWLAETVCSAQLKPTIPAKKRPAYPELAGARPTLDPSQPVKKRVPVFSEGFGGLFTQHLEGLFTQHVECASLLPQQREAALVPR
jgi:hypothetical protein